MIAPADIATTMMRAARPLDAPSSFGRKGGASSGGFVDMLQQLQLAAPAQPLSEGDKPEVVHDAMTKLVASALVLPALATLRESGFREGPFAPGDAERRFGPLLDQAVADRVIQAAHFPLIDALVKHSSGIVGEASRAADLAAGANVSAAAVPRELEVLHGSR